jgi:hypothetical protein
MNTPVLCLDMLAPYITMGIQLLYTCSEYPHDTFLEQIVDLSP